MFGLYLVVRSFLGLVRILRCGKGGEFEDMGLEGFRIVVVDIVLNFRSFSGISKWEFEFLTIG